MNKELYDEAIRSGILSRKLIEQLMESMNYSSISFINWTVEVLKIIKTRLERGDKITDEVSGITYDIKSFRNFVSTNFSSYITSQVFDAPDKAEKVYFSLEATEDGHSYNMVMASSSKNKTYKWILNTVDKELQMCQTVDAVVCLTKGTHQVLTNIYRIDQEKIFLIPNGLKRNQYINSKMDKNKLREQYYIDDKEKVILFAGRLSEFKGIYAVLDAFCILLKEFSNIRLVLAGSLLPEFVLSNYAHISTKVTYTGHLERKELKKWYQMADIGVIPSYTEQCSYVGIEMMMHGLPIVTSDGFGLRDMFKDQGNAIVVPIGKRTKKNGTFSENLVHALTMLLSSETLMNEIGRNARKAYLKHYGLCQMKEGYKRLLDAF